MQSDDDIIRLDKLPGGHAAILVARLLLVPLFLVFGWSKLIHFGATIDAMAQQNLPFPPATALVVVAVEFPLCVLLLIGAWTRPLALLLGVYTVATALVAHRFWEVDGPAHVGAAINFYKNVSIMGGFLLLYVTGAGKYSVDAQFLKARPRPNPATT